MSNFPLGILRFKIPPRKIASNPTKGVANFIGSANTPAKTKDNSGIATSASPNPTVERNNADTNKITNTNIRHSSKINFQLLTELLQN